MNVVVLGFDGVDPRLLSKLRRRRNFEGFDRIQKDGVYSDLDSTVIPISAMAWSSFLTGCNPGKHGVYDFVTRDGPESTDFKITTSNDCRAPQLWQYLNEKGYRVGVVGVPLTYPVDDLDGFAVSGYPTPSRDRSFSPASLADEAPVDPHDLHAKVHFDGTNKEEFIEDQFRQWDAIEEFYRYALEEKSWDVLVNVFKQTDDIAHVAWGEEPLFEAYQRADAILQYTQAYLESLDEDYFLVAMSDHGFGEVEKTLFLNNVLRDLGHLELRDGLTTKLRDLLCRGGINMLNAYKVAAKLGIGERLMSVGYDDDTLRAEILYALRNAFLLGTEDIDLERSACFSRGNYGQLFVNDEGQMDDIVDDLLSYTVDGEHIVADVHRADEHFSGDATDVAPDLMIEPPGYRYLTSRGFALATDRILTDHIIGRDAEHKPTGVFFCTGSDVRDGADVDNPTLEDFLPTIFQAMDEPIPDYTDGRVLPVFDDAGETRYERYDAARTAARDDLSSEETEELRSQLESLGYAN